MRSLHLLAVTTILAATLTTDSSSLAQNSSPGAGASFQKRTGPPRETRHEVFKQFPTDLKIPYPPDARFMSGYRTQYASTRLATVLRFQSGNPPAKIADWYQKTLSGTGWTVTAGKPGVDNSSFTAYRPGAFCSMYFRLSRASDAKGLMSTAMVNYTETK